jgi:hypothetical protein
MKKTIVVTIIKVIKIKIIAITNSIINSKNIEDSSFPSDSNKNHLLHRIKETPSPYFEKIANFNYLLLNETYPVPKINFCLHPPFFGLLTPLF